MCAVDVSGISNTTVPFYVLSTKIKILRNVMNMSQNNDRDAALDALEAALKLVKFTKYLCKIHINPIEEFNANLLARLIEIEEIEKEIKKIIIIEGNNE